MALPATVAFAKDKPDFKQYKRIHQKALNLIRTGKAVAAVEFLALAEAKLPRTPRRSTCSPWRNAH